MYIRSLPHSVYLSFFFFLSFTHTQHTHKHTHHTTPTNTHTHRHKDTCSKYQMLLSVVCFQSSLLKLKTEIFVFEMNWLKVKLCCDTRFQREFTACSCVWANQGNYFEKATACWKRLSQLSFTHHDSVTIFSFENVLCSELDFWVNYTEICCHILFYHRAFHVAT